MADKRKVDRRKKSASKRSPARQYSHRYDPRALLAYGPVIKGLVSIPDAMRAALKVQGKPVPEPVACNFLVDTGATRSFVIARIADEARIPCIDDAADFHGLGTIRGRRLFGRIDLLLGGDSDRVTMHTEINSADLPHAPHIDVDELCRLVRR